MKKCLLVQQKVPQEIGRGTVIQVLSAIFCGTAVLRYQFASAV